jgi:hypothetical protein
MREEYDTLVSQMEAVRDNIQEFINIIKKIFK